MKHSHHLAVELAEFLGMLQPADISPELNSLQILISIHEEEVSTSDRKNQSENDKEQDENDETDFSAAITEASHEMRRISTEGNNEENLSNLFQEGCSQLTLIDQVSEDLSTLYNGDSSKSCFKNIHLSIKLLHCFQKKKFLKLLNYHLFSFFIIK